MIGRGLVSAAALAAAALLVAAAAEPIVKEPEPAVLVDATGKEIKLANARFIAGVRRLAWLADPAGTTDDAKKGPLALELREPHSTTYQKGVVTLIPVVCVSSVRYETDKQTMFVAVKGIAEPLPGTLQFKGINVCGVEGTSGGITGKFAGGGPKDSFKSIAFPGAAPLPTRPAGGIAWAVQIDQVKAGHPTLAVRNLKALYAYPGGVEQLAADVPTRKGDPLLLEAKLKKIEVLAVDTNTQMVALEVTGADGVERIVAVPLTREAAGRTGLLVGLVGEVDAGWKLFPLHTIKAAKPAEPN